MGAQLVSGVDSLSRASEYPGRVYQGIPKYPVVTSEKQIENQALALFLVYITVSIIEKLVTSNFRLCITIVRAEGCDFLFFP